VVLCTRFRLLLWRSDEICFTGRMERRFGDLIVYVYESLNEGFILWRQMVLMSLYCIYEYKGLSECFSTDCAQAYVPCGYDGPRLHSPRLGIECLSCRCILCLPLLCGSDAGGERVPASLTRRFVGIGRSRYRQYEPHN
jgi:hypothetical protein